MEHYYTNNPTTKSCEQIINSKISGEDFKFYTDNGVFSKDGVDFGTKVLLENFSSQKEVANVADIGCGYGVISIVLAKQNPSYSFTMVDVNNRSLVLTKKNIELNRIENKVEIIESSSFDNVKGDFDIVLTNPPIRAGKKIVHQIMIDSFNHLSESGELWVVIQKNKGWQVVKNFLKKLFLLWKLSPKTKDTIF